MSKRLQIGVFLIVTILLAFSAQSTQAHTPHDDVYGLEISPTYTNDQTAYAIIRGNFFRTVDGGETWQRPVQGLDNAYGFHSLTLPAQDGNVLYMSSLGDGVYKSVDRGDTWVSVSDQLNELEIRQVVGSKSSTEVVLALGNQHGLYRTEDGGQSWQEIESNALGHVHLTTVAFSSADSSNVYAGDEEGNLYISDDLGISWAQCCSFAADSAVMSIVFSNTFAEDKTLFVGTEKGGVFKSTDGGQTLVAQNEGLGSKNIQSLLVSRNFSSDNTVYAVSRHHGVFRSNDGGGQWAEVNSGLFTDGQSFEYKRPTFNILRSTESFAQDETLFLATFTGIYKTEDSGDSWFSKDTLLGEIVVGLAVAPPVDSEPMIGVSHYFGDAYLVDEDESFRVNVMQGVPGLEPIESLIGVLNGNSLGKDPSRLLTLPMRLHDVAFSPSFANDNTAFVSLRNYLLRTTDGGQNWEAINTNDDPLGIKAYRGQGKTLIGFVLAISPTFEADKTLFIATQNGLLLKSTDRGDTVVELGSISDMLTAMQISPDYNNDKTLFSAGYHTGVHKSVDGGETWTPINSGLDIESGGLAGEFQLAVSSNYAADQTLFLGSVAGLFKSVDGGANWRKVPCGECTTDWNVSSVAVSPNFVNDGTVVLSAKGIGIFKSTTGGDTFALVKESLIDQGVTMSNLHNSPTTSGTIKFSPNFAVDQTIYGFSGALLVKSVDGGDTWSIVPKDYIEGTQISHINLIFGQYFVYPAVIIGGFVGGVLLLFIVLWLIKRVRSRRQAMPLAQGNLRQPV